MKIPKKVEISSLLFSVLLKWNLEHTKLQQDEHGNMDITTFDIAAPDGKVH